MPTRRNPAANRNWSHGQLQGSAVMIRQCAKRIMDGTTVTPTAKHHASAIATIAEMLCDSLKERRNV